MPEASSGTPYVNWINRFESKDEIARLGAQYELVTLYDQKGRPQLVRGDAVPGQLAKTDDNGDAIFFSDYASTPKSISDAIIAARRDAI